LQDISTSHGIWENQATIGGMDMILLYWTFSMHFGYRHICIQDSWDKIILNGTNLVQYFQFISSISWNMSMIIVCLECATIYAHKHTILCVSLQQEGFTSRWIVPHSTSCLK
jgi:hypothetical protein